MSASANTPELDPVEHLWDELREKFFHNLVFDNLDALERYPEYALYAQWGTTPANRCVAVDY